MTARHLYSLQHVGYSIPPQGDASWIGEAGPGPSYGDLLDDGARAGLNNDFINSNTTFMTWNLLHLARLLKTPAASPPTGTSGRNGTRARVSTPRTPNTDHDHGDGTGLDTSELDAPVAATWMRLARGGRPAVRR
jgi:hypothetical protein